MDGGGAGGHARAQLACLKTPQQFLIGAAQPFLLVALLLHVYLQVGILLRELPNRDMQKLKHEYHVLVRFPAANLYYLTLYFSCRFTRDVFG